MRLLPRERGRLPGARPGENPGVGRGARLTERPGARAVREGVRAVREVRGIWHASAAFMHFELV